MCYQLSHIFSNNTYFSIKFRTDRSESLRTSFESAAGGELGEFLMNFFSCLEVGHTSTSNWLPMVIAKVLADPSQGEHFAVLPTYRAVSGRKRHIG